MARSFISMRTVKLSKAVIDHPLWTKWYQGRSEDYSQTNISIEELVDFAKHNKIEQVELITDVDGASCRLTGGIFHIHKIADSPTLALLAAIKDLEKEVYEIECNRGIPCA